MTPGYMDFRGAHQNDTEKSACGRPFFFGDHLKILRKRWHFSLKTFFFLKLHRNWDKTEAFSLSVLEFTKPELRNI